MTCTDNLIVYNSFGHTDQINDVELDSSSNQEDIFVKIGKSIHAEVGSRKLYKFQERIRLFLSEMISLTSEINRLKKNEMDNTDFSYIKDGISESLSIEDGKYYLKNKMAKKFNSLINWLRELNNDIINVHVNSLIQIFQNLNEGYLVRDFSRKVIYSDAEKQLSFSSNLLSDYISSIEAEKFNNKKKNENLSISFPTQDFFVGYFKVFRTYWDNNFPISFKYCPLIFLVMFTSSGLFCFLKYYKPKEKIE